MSLGKVQCIIHNSFLWNLPILLTSHFLVVLVNIHEKQIMDDVDIPNISDCYSTHVTRHIRAYEWRTKLASRVC